MLDNILLLLIIETKNQDINKIFNIYTGFSKTKDLGKFILVL